MIMAQLIHEMRDMDNFDQWYDSLGMGSYASTVDHPTLDFVAQYGSFCTNYEHVIRFENGRLKLNDEEYEPNRRLDWWWPVHELTVMQTLHGGSYNGDSMYRATLGVMVDASTWNNDFVAEHLTPKRFHSWLCSLSDDAVVGKARKGSKCPIAMYLQYVQRLYGHSTVLAVGRLFINVDIGFAQRIRPISTIVDYKMHPWAVEFAQQVDMIGGDINKSVAISVLHRVMDIPGMGEL